MRRMVMMRRMRMTTSGGYIKRVDSGEQTIHNQPWLGIEYTVGRSSVAMDQKSTTGTNSEDLEVVVVDSKPGSKEAMVQGKYSKAENKQAMGQVKSTQGRNRVALDGEVIIDMP